MTTQATDRRGGRHIDAADVAKLIRKELRATFPGSKFSVRTARYAGGSSIDVIWTDGPTTSAVEKLVGAFHGKTFDGMDDSTHYHDTLYDGELVHFGNGYLFTRRSFSDGFVQRVIDALAVKYNASDPPSVEDYKQGRAYQSSPILNTRGDYDSWQGLITRAAGDRNLTRAAA